MYLIPLPKRKPNGQSRIDPHRRTVPNVKITTAEIAGDGSSFFFGEVAGAFIWTESGSGCAGEGAIIIVIVLLRDVGLDVGEAHGCNKAGHCRGWCMM